VQRKGTPKNRSGARVIPIAAAITDANTCVRWLSRDQPDLEEARGAAIREMALLPRSESAQHVVFVRTELAADLPQVMGD
jgi:hypothetical protein